MAIGWAHTMNVADDFNADEGDFDQLVKNRDALVSRFKNDGWCKQFLQNPSHGLGWLVFQLSETEDFDEFNEVWDDIYDWADVNRLWLQVF